MARCWQLMCWAKALVKKDKVFYGQEPPSGESITQNVGSIINYLQLYTEVVQWGTPSCSRPQLATYNGVRYCRSNLLVAPITLMGSTPGAPRIARCKRGLQIAKLAAATGARTHVHGYARTTHCLCGHSGYEDIFTNVYNITLQTFGVQHEITAACVSDGWSSEVETSTRPPMHVWVMAEAVKSRPARDLRCMCEWWLKQWSRYQHETTDAFVSDIWSSEVETSTRPLLPATVAASMSVTRASGIVWSHEPATNRKI